MGRRVQYKGTAAALKGAAMLNKGAARHGGQASGEKDAGLKPGLNKAGRKRRPLRGSG